MAVRSATNPEPKVDHFVGDRIANQPFRTHLGLKVGRDLDLRRCLAKKLSAPGNKSTRRRA